MNEIKENSKKATDNLNIDDRNELEGLSKLLEELDENNAINDVNLKIRIAKISAELVEKTPDTSEAMISTASVIVDKFIWYNYGDRLDEIMTLAGELELPEENVSEDFIEKWNKMKSILDEYLGLK